MIRPAGPGDAESVTVLEATCLGDDAWPAGLVVEGLSGNLPTVAYLVAELDAEVVGHAVVSTVGDVAELQRIAVAGGRRRTGLGRELLDACLAHAGVQGAHRMLLEVREDNEAARGLYARAGFTELDRRLRYFRDGAAAVVLERNLTQPTSPDS